MRRRQPRHFAQVSRRRSVTRRLVPVALLGAVALGVVLTAAGGPTTTNRPTSAGGSSTAGGPTIAKSLTGCPQLYVPAFFRPGPEWAALAKAKAPPSTVLLDLTSLGAGTAPEAGFRPAVAALQARGVQVLGYSTTSYGTRPIPEVVDDVRHYAAWYGVHNVFLDEVTSGLGHLGYYESLQKAIRAVEPKAKIWLNPGTYPARAYMHLGDVVMAFEGPWSSFRHLVVPSWAHRYAAPRFAFVVYGTGAGNLGGVVRLTRRRHAGYLYVTDGTGGNPYAALPSYFAAEDAATAGCAKRQTGS